MSSATPGGDQLIGDPGQLAAKVLEWRARGYHVLSPATSVWAFAPGYGVNVSMVVLDPRVDADGLGEDTYFDKATMDAPNDNVMDPYAERAINATGLRRISQCAGIVWHPDLTGRVDDRRIQNLWEYRAVGLIQGYDGSWLSLHGTKEVDLRDGSAQIGGWTPEGWADLMEKNGTLPKDAKKKFDIHGWSERRVLNQRCNGLAMSETKATNRAIRTIGLSQKYTVAELACPFVVLRVSYIPDLADPATRQRVLDRGLSGSSALFAPQQTRRALPEVSRDLEGEVVQPRPLALVPPITALQSPTPPTGPTSVGPVVHVTVTPIPDSAVPPAQSAPAPAAAPAANPPQAETPPVTLPPNAVFVKACTIGKQGTSARGPWTRFDITVDNGTRYSTFSETHSKIAAEAIHGHLPVVITSEEGKYGTPELTDITIVDTRQLTLPVDGAPPDLTKDGIKW